MLQYSLRSSPEQHLEQQQLQQHQQVQWPKQWVSQAAVAAKHSLT